MNFHFIWKAFDVATGEITGIYEQTIYGETLSDAAANFTTMHGELAEDIHGEALEIHNITEVRK